MHILENVREPSRPIDIPNKKKRYAQIAVHSKTRSNDILLWIDIEYTSGDLIHGKIMNTPPSEKYYKKNEIVIVHRDNILNYVANKNEICMK
jgi:hypothetical protein